VRALGKMDPFVRVRIGNEQFDTKVIANGGRNCTWNHAMAFNLDGKADCATFFVYDEGFVHNTPIGRYDVDVVRLVVKNSTTVVPIVNPNNFQMMAGKVTIETTFEGKLPAELQPPKIEPTIKDGPAPVFVVDQAGNPVALPQLQMRLTCRQGHLLQQYGGGGAAPPAQYSAGRYSCDECSRIFEIPHVSFFHCHVKECNDYDVCTNCVRVTSRAQSSNAQETAGASLWFETSPQLRVLHGAALTRVVDTDHGHGFYTISATPKQGDSFQFNFDIKRTTGRYMLNAQGVKLPNGGTVRWTLDNAIIGTQDWYASSKECNAQMAITNLDLTVGPHVLKGDVVGCNGSSSGYAVGLSRVDFRLAA